MNKSTHQPIRNVAQIFLIAIFVASLTLGRVQTVYAASNGPASVNLGAAAPYAILTKTGITNVPASSIIGNLGASPIASTAITGFSMVADSTNTFSTSTQVKGKIYAANYASPTPAELTKAIGNMQTAYTDAAGRSLPDFTELYAGNLNGRTLAPGLYKWSSGVLLTSNVTLAGPANAVWIFQIAGNLTMGSGAKMLLSGGAQSRNIFWQVGGGVGVEIGTTAHAEGTILAAKAIHMRTGASLNGRALAQTAVTLEKNKIVIPAANVMFTRVFTSTPIQDGWVLESVENSNVGSALSSTSTTFRLGDNELNKQYRVILHFDTSTLPDTAVITKLTLKIMRQASTGTNPFATHGPLRADVANPFFGSSTALQPADFQANSSGSSIALFGATPVNNWYMAAVNNMGISFVNKTGSTQFRLRFTLDDNNNHIANYVTFSSGNWPTAAERPQLVVQYYLP